MQRLADLAQRSVRRVIGLISGTSADGIDAALVEVSGTGLRARLRLITGLTVPFRPADRDELFRMFDPSTATVDRITAFNFHLGDLFADAALAVIAQAGVPVTDVDLIGSHGQTIWHIPAPHGSTLQIGEPAVIAERTGLPVVADFRVADMAAGGQGAPLASYFDLVVFRHPTLTRAAQNIGGIGNVTYLPARTPDGCGPEDVLAFDTGPGNLVIDAVVADVTGGQHAFDRDGTIATRGHISVEWLAQLLADPYLHQTPPKTTGREIYGAPFARRLLTEAQARGLSADDTVATVSALTADSIIAAYWEFLLPRGPLHEVVLSGGGSYNGFLRRRIAAALGIPVRTSEDLGINGKLKEAMLIALLASDAVAGVPTNVPAATGARGPRVLGKFVPPPLPH
jgi:anhydro-N-acetylmuramic acid kinase